MMKQALLLIDIQNDYFAHGANPLAGSAQASLRAKDVLSFCRTQAIPIVHVQHIASRGAAFFVEGTLGADIHSDVKPIEGEKVITKHFPNRFRQTDLLDYLRLNSITDLIICGMMTHMCVDATVRAAKDYGFECVLIGDACATKDLTLGSGREVCAADVQTTMLASLAYFYASVCDSAQWILSQKESFGS